MNLPVNLRERESPQIRLEKETNPGKGQRLEKLRKNR
jgi:hypothetical protein